MSKNKFSSNIYSNSIDIGKKIKKKRILNVIVIVLSLLCALGGSVILYGNSMLASLNSNAYSKAFSTSDDSSGDATFTNNIIKDPMVLNIMVFGSDLRPDAKGNGNADTMLMFSIDNRRKKLKIISFMRDMFLEIPGHERAKLNAAYAWGGPDLSVEAIEKNFGVDIDRYVVLYFDTFPQIIDALGGIDVDLTEEEAAYLRDRCDIKQAKGAGTCHLEGEGALQYVMMRHVGGGDDFARTRRQRYFVTQIVNKFKSTSDVTTIASLMTKFLPAITTNISVDEMTGLAKNSIKYMNYPLVEYRLPTSDNVSDGTDKKWGAVLNVKSLKKAREDIARFIYEDTANSIYGTTASSLPDLK